MFVQKPLEMKKLILYLKNENELLRDGRLSNHQNQMQEPQKVETRVDNDNVINNLMDKINVLTEEKERLQNAVRTLKENSMLADKSPMDKQLWILKRTNAQLVEEKKVMEDRINSLQRELLEKNLKIEELSKKLGITYTFKSESPAPANKLHKGLTWTDKLKQVFT